MKKIYNVKIELDTDKINYNTFFIVDVYRDRLIYALEELLPYHFTILQIKEE